MINVTVSELTGPALDWAVAKCEGLVFVMRSGHPAFEQEFDPDLPCSEGCIKEWKCWTYYRPSTDWSQGGPLIESEELTVSPCAFDWKGVCILWRAKQEGAQAFEHVNLLVAAMRAIVAAKLGDTVDVPEEFLAAA